MSKFKLKKPDVYEAFQWTGGPDQTEDPIWMIEAIKHNMAGFFTEGDCRLWIGSPPGADFVADSGDWIVRSPDGEIFPCKPDFFAATYEKTDDE